MNILICSFLSANYSRQFYKSLSFAGTDFENCSYFVALQSNKKHTKNTCRKFFVHPSVSQFASKPKRIYSKAI